MLCPACQFEQPPGHRFCEECGANLVGKTVEPSPTWTCPHCGANTDATDFCPRCGVEKSSPSEDHFEVAVSPEMAGVSDRGRRHERNEDFLTLGSSVDGEVLVVCDGVSNSQQSQRASRAAATVCLKTLTALGTDATDCIRRAFGLADQAVRDLPAIAGHPADPAETTVVAAVRRGDEITIGWLGDSRAYWVDANSVRPLTVDHSWLNETVAAGEMTRGQALLHPHAHGITRTLGGPVSEGGFDEPSIATFRLDKDLPRPGWLLLCTDGFWDFHDTDEQFAEFLVDRLRLHPPEANAVKLAGEMVEAACVKRGHDNITVGLLHVS